MEWWKKVPDAWKVVIAVIGGITLVIGTYRGVDAYFAKELDLRAHKRTHNLDIAEVSESFQKTQIRQDLRWNSKEQYELEMKVRAKPNEADRERLNQLKMEKEELERDLMDIKSKKFSPSVPEKVEAR